MLYRFIGGAAAVVIFLALVSGCSRSCADSFQFSSDSTNTDVDAAAASAAKNTDPMELCNQCVARICAPCAEKTCVPALKTEYCQGFKNDQIAPITKLPTDEQKQAKCQVVAGACDSLLEVGRRASRRVTPEDEPLVYAGARVRRAKEVVSDDRLRRRVLACEVLERVKALDRSERIDRRMLDTRPRRYIGRPVYFDGRVLQVQDFESEGATAFLIRLGRTTVHVLYPELTDLVERQAVRFFGYVAGDYSYRTVAGWNMTVPQVAAVVVASRRELHPRRLHCPDDLPDLGDDQ